MAHDTTERFGEGLIQHGPQNNRIYLMKLEGPGSPDYVARLEQLAREQQYTKIFAKVPADKAGAFCASGYRLEARVPGFFRGETDGLFLGAYLDPARAHAPDADRIERNIEIARAKAREWSGPPELDPRFTIRPAGPDDAEAMADVYREVFETYPFPIHDPDYLRETMRTHIDYFVVCERGRMVAVSSAEMDHENRNVEMTDFATRPAWRGHGLAVHLLELMDTAMADRGMPTAYTIARAASAGMNVTFARCGYTFAGTLINNTQISGGLESMNIWYKPL